MDGELVNGLREHAACGYWLPPRLHAIPPRSKDMARCTYCERPIGHYDRAPVVWSCIACHNKRMAELREVPT